jgi:hypothetical protein
MFHKIELHCRSKSNIAHRSDDRYQWLKTAIQEGLDQRSWGYELYYPFCNWYFSQLQHQGSASLN